MSLAPVAVSVNVSPNIRVGVGSVIDASALLGVMPRRREGEDLFVVLGEACVIRAMTTIYAGTSLGDRVQTGHGAMIREDNVIGSDVSIGTNAVLEPGNRIGDGARIHSGCFLELVTLERDVFIGPNVTFADDLHPPCPRYETCVRGAVVRAGASLGANSTVLPGVEIGERALVGAGSVVTVDVPPEVVVVGNPARVICSVHDLKCRSGSMPHPYSWRR